MSISANPMADTQIAADAHLLWEYHQLDHMLRDADLAIGLGSSDFDVPEEVARVYNEGYVVLVAFTGANSRTTKERYPNGEAMEFRDRAVELGVPTDSIVLETDAKNTGQNFTFTRDLVQAQGHTVASIIVACMPYMQRRAYATCKKVWPEVEVMCTSKAMHLTDYIAKLANPKKVLDDLTGDTWRVLHYPEQGFAIPQDVPDDVQASLERLIAAGFTGRLQDKVHRDAITDPLRDPST